jgi:hypothetical protein
MGFAGDWSSTKDSSLKTKALSDQRFWFSQRQLIPVHDCLLNWFPFQHITVTDTSAAANHAQD